MPQQIETRLIPQGTRVYKTFADACKFQCRLPGGVQPVFSARTKNVAGWAALPEKINGTHIYWVV